MIFVNSVPPLPALHHLLCSRWLLAEPANMTTILCTNQWAATNVKTHAEKRGKSAQRGFGARFGPVVLQTRTTSKQIWGPSGTNNLHAPPGRTRAIAGVPNHAWVSPGRPVYSGIPGCTRKHQGIAGHIRGRPGVLGYTQLKSIRTILKPH